MKNSADNVFDSISFVTDGQAALVGGFLNGGDFAPTTRRAFRNDLRKFIQWFTAANKEGVLHQQGDDPRCGRLP